MGGKRQFDPIPAAKKIEESYRSYLATTIHFEDAGLQAQLRDILASRNFLAKGPFLETTPPYAKDKTLRQLVEDGELCRGMLGLGGFDLDRPLYIHQVNAIRKANEGKNYIVVTGTGSGKTECFLLPIINDILREFEEIGPSAGVRAMILYPMNALANDQLKRLRELLAGTDITFGRYTGDTAEYQADGLQAWKAENPAQTKLPNELVSREQIRLTPPNIMLTNYSMLEYLLMRPQDAPLFQGAFGKSWRHIAIDEAHIYSGALGTEIAYLLRRLKARIRSDSGRGLKLNCYATSATIGSETDTPKVAKFAQDIFGEPFDQGPDAPSVIKSVQDSPKDDLRERPWGKLPLEAWPKLRKALAEGATKESVRAALVGSVPDEQLSLLDIGGDTLDGLGEILLGEESTAKLVKRASVGLIDLTDVTSIGEIEIEALEGNDEGVEILTSMVEVLSAARRSEDVPVLASRYHSFMRAPEGLFIDLSAGRLIAEKTVGIPFDEKNETPVYEVSVCRHCGQAYILGQERKTKEHAWLDPKHVGTDADDDFRPRSYYRLAYTGLEETSEDEDRETSGREIQWLCPTCGTLHDAEVGGPHRFPHPECVRVPLELGTATEEDSRCTHCGYRNRYAIQPMRVSPEAAGSIVCYELARLLPPFDSPEPDRDDLFAEFDDSNETERPGSVICFSDKRQDAAFFAPAMERTYDQITVRQIIREAVCELDAPDSKCAPSDVARWISTEGLKRHPMEVEGVSSNLARSNLAWAWVIDELEAEDSRNSLEGLGVVKIEPLPVMEYLEGSFAKAIPRTIASLPDQIKQWVEPEDYLVLLRMCLDTLRERAGLDVQEGADSFRRNRTKSKLIVKGDDDEANPDKNILFVGSTNKTENKRSKIVRRYAAAVHGVEASREDARALLRNMYTFLVQLLGAIDKKENTRLIVGNAAGFRLSPDVWRFAPCEDDDPVYVCDTCSCEYHYDTKGVCLGNNCQGTTIGITFAKAKTKDEYYKDVYQQTALPLRIEEHTAQLSSERARSIQQGFIDGKVHILSCTTTFELGVDVGELRAVFMRNVPPSTANYTQRAGRTGRRGGMPGYAITFARLRPHDIAFYREPESIIKGRTKPPMCYLDNDVIARRHIFAVVLSQYFRDRNEKDGVNLALKFNDFLSLEKAEPEGLEQLDEYLAGHPSSISAQLSDIFESIPAAASRIGIDAWSWVNDLTSRHDGRLTRAHLMKHSDYARLTIGMEESREQHLGYAQALERSREGLKKEPTISVLAENGVLPKYGFPTDLVDLSLMDQESSSKANTLDLQRGLRLAVREYAPGAEVVAGKKLWRSTGIKKMRGREFEIRGYGKCPECENFVWAIDAGDVESDCPVCGTPISFKQRMLVPSFGFTGELVSKGVGVQRPRPKGSMRIHFSQRWPEEYEERKCGFDGGTVAAKFASNAQLCVVNTGEATSGFNVCLSCGAASTGRVSHARYCKAKGGKAAHFSSLGTTFVSDVLELTLGLEVGTFFDEDDWQSLLWALFAAAASILEVPESEIGGTMYSRASGNMSVMIYDDVPGGAGHALQLSEMVDELFKKAYKIASSCTCDENTCCYGCLCNYMNQNVQHKLSRGGAMKILEALFGTKGETT